MAGKLKPQDVVLLLKLLCPQDLGGRRTIALAYELGISQSEVSQGLSRLKKANLIDESKKLPLRKNAIEFLVHGLKYVFPVSPGAIERGVPTAHSAPVLSSKIKSSEKLVWPYADGKVKGQSIAPLYRSVPEAALKDRELYDLLALCDALRVGRVREKNIAIKVLESKILRES